MVDQKIKTFLTLIETGSYTKTAEKLFITQPAVSHQIRQMEEAYGSKLVYQEKRKLHVTAEGEIVLKYARRCMVLSQAALQALEDNKRHVKRLAVGMTPTSEEHVLPQVMGLYCTRHPETRVTIKTGNLESIRARLKDNELDLAIVGGVIADDDFLMKPVDFDHLCLVVSPESSLAQSRGITLEQLKQEQLILRPIKAATRRLFEEFLRDNGETIKNYDIVLEVDNVSSIKELVSRGLGVSIISNAASLVEQSEGKLVAVPFLETIGSMDRKINLIFRKSFRHPEVAEEILSLYAQLDRKKH